MYICCVKTIWQLETKLWTIIQKSLWDMFSFILQNTLGVELLSCISIGLLIFIFISVILIGYTKYSESGKDLLISS